VSKRCKQGQKKGNKLKPVNRKNLCALLIIDLDGTVLRTDKTISLRFKEAAREASNKGIKLVFASGRTLENLIDFVTELEFLPNDNYIIACNGALIWEQKVNKFFVLICLFIKIFFTLTNLHRRFVLLAS
jgi:hydroxymethylpyrimidine pyrophosphatase-like HAD family hydrolase